MERIDTPSFFTLGRFTDFLSERTGTYTKPHDVLSDFILQHICCDTPEYRKRAGKLLASTEGMEFEVPAVFADIVDTVPHTYEDALKRAKAAVKGEMKGRVAEPAE